MHSSGLAFLVSCVNPFYRGTTPYNVNEPKYPFKICHIHRNGQVGPGKIVFTPKKNKGKQMNSHLEKGFLVTAPIFFLFILKLDNFILHSCLPLQNYRFRDRFKLCCCFFFFFCCCCFFCFFFVFFFFVFANGSLMRLV